MMIRNRESGKKRINEILGAIMEIISMLILLMAAAALSFFLYQYVLAEQEAKSAAASHVKQEDAPFSIEILTEMDEKTEETVLQENKEIPNALRPVSEPAAIEILKNVPRLTIDHEGLKAGNPAYEGWIQIPGTRISYPVYRSKDNQDLLHHRPDGSYLYAGSIFMDARTPMAEIKDYQRNLIIYGHNMISGSMFASLHDYQSLSFYNEHPFIVFYPYDGKAEFYRIHSVLSVGADTAENEILLPYLPDTAYHEYVENIKSRALYETNVSIENEIRLMTLSTCIGNSKSNRRFIVSAVLMAVASDGQA